MFLKWLVTLSALTVVCNAEFDSGYKDFKVLEKYTKSQIAEKNQKTVLLQLYYECLCTCCIDFHTGILHDTYEKIGSSYIDLKLYPYGNTLKHEVENKTVFACQHGPSECYGNKLHACAIDILKNMSQSESYISCMMLGQWGGAGSCDMDAARCGDLMGIDSKPITECARGEQGDKLMEYYANETAKVKGRRFVPYLLVNGKYFEFTGPEFMKKICDILDNVPPACKEQFIQV